MTTIDYTEALRERLHSRNVVAAHGRGRRFYFLRRMLGDFESNGKTCRYALWVSTTREVCRPNEHPWVKPITIDNFYISEQEIDLGRLEKGEAIWDCVDRTVIDRINMTVRSPKEEGTNGRS